RWVLLLRGSRLLLRCSRLLLHGSGLLLRRRPRWRVLALRRWRVLALRRWRVLALRLSEDRKRRPSQSDEEDGAQRDYFSHHVLLLLPFGCSFACRSAGGCFECIVTASDRSESRSAGDFYSRPCDSRARVPPSMVLAPPSMVLVMQHGRCR